MLTIRKSEERGHANHGWLDTHHSFSFANYYDPRHMGFRDLRVINDDRIEAGAGFPNHSHRDMEIITYVVEGALAHRDSMGNGSVIRPGEVQRMSAGTGVAHSEFNPSDDEALRLLQIWIRPNAMGLAPGYEQKHFSEEERHNRLLLVASPDGAQDSVRLNQDVYLYASLLSAGEALRQRIAPGRHAWLQVVEGKLSVNGAPLSEGDGAAFSDESELEIRAESDGHFLVFDLA